MIASQDFHVSTDDTVGAEFTGKLQFEILQTGALQAVDNLLLIGTEVQQAG